MKQRAPVYPLLRPLTDRGDEECAGEKRLIGPKYGCI